MFIRKRIFLIPFFVFILSGIFFSFTQPILFVEENTDDSKTCLQLYDPLSGEISQLTDPESDNFYRISFPVVNEKKCIIGFTNHSENMEASVFVINPDSHEPLKIVEKAILEDISPDGKYLLVSSASSSPSLYIVDIEKRTVERITEGYTVNSACYSPDGKAVVFAVMDNSGKMDLYELDILNKKINPLIVSSSWNEYYPSYTKDGRYLLFMTDRTGKWGVDYLNMDTKERYQADLWGMYPRLSNDDSWAVYEKDGKIMVSRTTGKEISVLFEGMTPQWISEENASRFMKNGGIQTASTDNYENEDGVIISKTIDASGGIVEAVGKLKVSVPPDTVGKNDGGNLKVYESSIEIFSGKIFEFEWENTPDLFAKFVEIEIPVDAGVNPDEIIAVDEIGENTWVVIPFEYDSENRSVKIRTAHFSKKGIISEISPSQIRKIFSGAAGAFATCGTIIFITGSTAITLPVTGAVAAGALVFGATEIANPLLDKAYELYHGLNRTIAVDDGIYVSWVDDANNASNLPGEKYLICVEKATKKILLFMDDPNLDPSKRAAAMTSLFPFSKYELINVPKSVIELAAEIKWLKNYYRENGYGLPPSTDIWIYRMNTSGGWNGAKLELDIEYFETPQEATKASRMVTLAHEYWHSIYQYNGYSPNFKWLDECLATVFESEALLHAKRWYDNSILPKYEHFYDMYPADKVAESLRSGFIFEGKQGIDADRIKRGYQLWPWGKFILATQGQGEILSLLKNDMDSKLFSSYFEQFCKSLLIEDFEIGNYIEENLIFEGKPIDYETVTGWNFLNAKSFKDNSVLVPGNSASGISEGIFRKSVPLSLNMMNFKSVLPSEQSPLVIRRSIPDIREEYLALNPYKPGNANGRQKLDETESGEGILVISRDWFDPSGKSVEFPVAIINSSVEENWTEYFGYGENPLYAYFLKKPVNLKTNNSGNKTYLTWDSPDFGSGLNPERCLSSYNLYAADESHKNIVFLSSVPFGVREFEIGISVALSYSKIGVASVDKYAKSTSGNPLLSEIAWISLKSDDGKWVRVNEDYSYNFGVGFMNSESGKGSSLSYEDDCYKYELNMGNNFAKTANTITASAWNCPNWTSKGETARFTHSWSAFPSSIVPGQKITQTISVNDDGSSGKNTIIMNGSTEFEMNGIKEAVEAGGYISRSLGTWEKSKSKTFDWTVPKPDTLTLSNPSKYPLRITITVKAKGDGETDGYYSAFYEYKP